MIFSTQNNQVRDEPVCVLQDAVVGKYLLYPDNTKKRVAEGGLRLQGLFKRTLVDQPLVTIITVCLNSVKTLEQCILSVLGQTYKNIEYIIIDACSVDGTLDIIKKYENAVDYFVSEPDCGLYHAMNKGLELASGDFILVLNSDDWYVSDCVEALVNAKKKTQFDIITAGALQIDEYGEGLSPMLSIPFDASTYLRMTFRHETMLCSKEIYNRIGNYNLDYKIVSDWEFGVRLFLAGVSLYELPRPLLNFRLSGVSNQSQDNTLLLEERRRLIKNQFEFLPNEDVQFLSDRWKHNFEKISEFAEKYKHNLMLYVALVSLCNSNVSRGWWKRPSSTFREQPLVSVILPIYNAEAYLAECLDSILCQTIKNFEVICINDKSIDNSAAIIDSYIKRDARVKVVTNKINLGCGGSRNVGVRHSSGQYIFNIDPDDTIPQRSLEILTSLAIKHDNDLVRGAYIKEQKFLGKAAQKHIRSSLASKEHPVYQTTIKKTPELVTGPHTIEGHWCYLYRREIATSCPWPTDLKMGQDALFIVRVVLQAQKIAVTDSHVYNYRCNSSSAMNTFNFEKYMSVLLWRERAWILLNEAGLKEIGEFFLKEYPNTHWHEEFFKEYVRVPQQRILDKTVSAIRRIYSEVGIDVNELNYPKFNNKDFFVHAFNGDVDSAEKCIIQYVLKLEFGDQTSSLMNTREEPKFWRVSLSIIDACKNNNISEATRLYNEACLNLPIRQDLSKQKKHLDRLGDYIKSLSTNSSDDSYNIIGTGTERSIDTSIADVRVSVSTKSNNIEPFGIIVFGHTREHAIKEVLESLQRQDALNFTEVWLDGDQGNSELRRKCEKVAELVKSYPVKRVSSQRANFGFRKMILVALKEMCTKYKDILILEDDCFPTRDAVTEFRKELDLIRNDDEIFSVYGHHFLVPAENGTCGRFQGWGWATTSKKLVPILDELSLCNSMSEPAYLDFVKKSLTPSISKMIEVTPPRQPSATLNKFFAWDETVCLLCALHGLVHKPTGKRVIYNFGMGNGGAHFPMNPTYRKPPFNMITHDEIWDVF